MVLLLFHAVFLAYAVSCLVSSALISQGKVVTSSSQHENWAPSRIVDGDYRRNGDTCLCCAATQLQYNPWFQLDLGQIYTIRSMEILGRNEPNGHHLEGMRVLLKSVSDGFDDEETNVSTATYELNYNLSFPKASRYVSLVLYNRTRYFIACELSVYGDCQTGEFGDRCQYKCYCEGDPCNETGVCPSGKCQAGYGGLNCNTACSLGYYGSGCTEKCGFCASNEICDRTDGRCPSTCLRGFQGDNCKKECENGTFGFGCTERCGFCYESAVCHKNNGTCPGKCAAGYKGYSCKEECSQFIYGMDCNQTCGNCWNHSTCLHTNGTCIEGCMAGFKGDLCKTGCRDGRYGPGCTSDCGTCLNGSARNKMSGICDAGCGTGYKEPYCQEACTNGTYGDGCKSSCGNCKLGIVCNNVDGTCDGGCEPGYMPGLCVEECRDGRYGPGCTSDCGTCLNGSACNKMSGICDAGCGPGYQEPYCQKDINPEEKSNESGRILGGAVGGAVLFFCALVAIVVLIKIRKRRNSTDKDTINLERTPKPPEINILKRQIDEYDQVNEETSENVYSCLDHESNPVKICHLWDFIRVKKKEDYAFFHQEFNCLKSGLLFPHECAFLPSNKLKNVHRELCAYDHNRVPLFSEKNGDYGYINASFVNGFGKAKMFIASQGPNKDTLVDFLRMVWQQKIEIMLTDPFEKNTKKCLGYWDEDSEVEYGNLHVKLDTTMSNNMYAIRKLKIRQNTERWRNLTQFQFNAWPEKGIPRNTWSLVKFWRNVMADLHDNTKPIVVHCSSGVGRTGTFIALDNAYNQAKTDGTVRMLNTVKTLREQRVNMVETEQILGEPYEFLPKLNVCFLQKDDFSVLLNFADGVHTWNYNCLRAIFLRVDISMKKPDTSIYLFDCGLKRSAHFHHASVGQAYIRIPGHANHIIGGLTKAKSSRLINPIVLDEFGSRALDEQYVFLYEALADALLIGTKSISTHDFLDIYDDLMQNDATETEQRLQQQFRLIVESVDGGRMAENEYETLNKAEYQNMMLSHHKVKVVDTSTRLQTGLDYYQLNELDGSCLQSMDVNDAIILLKHPTSTMFEFQGLLNLIIEKNINTVITLKNTVRKKEEINIDLRQTVDFDSPSFGLKLVKESTWGAYNQQEFELVHEDSSIKVSQFEYRSWQRNQPAPNEPRPMLDFLGDVMKWQHQLSNKHPILVYDRGVNKRKVVNTFLHNKSRMVREWVNPFSDNKILICWSQFKGDADDKFKLIKFNNSSFMAENIMDNEGIAPNFKDAERIGLICVLMVELERMSKKNGQINIVETVKLMKGKDSSVIPNYEQYQFVHDVIRQACFDYI